MAFMQERNGQNRAGIVIGVGLIHLAVIYALVSGFGTTMIQILTKPNPQATDTPVEVPLPQPSSKPQPHTPLTHETLSPLPLPTLAPPLPQPFPIPEPTGNAGPQAPPSDPIPARPSPTPIAAKAIGRPGDWVSDDDYPANDIRLGHAGITRFALDIGSDGRVSACRITGSSGWPALDAAACAALTRRARFKPAEDGAGTRMGGSFASSVRWEIPR